jgi:hypothetical protein
MSAPWSAGRVLVGFPAAAVQVNKISFHRHFNRHDLDHVIQMGGTYLFYRGTFVLKDQ